MSLIANAGPFGLLVIVMGAVGLCIAVAQLATRRDLQGPVTWCAAMAMLLGITGTGFGLLTAADAVVQVDDAARAARMWMQAQAIAESTTTLGAMTAMADLAALAFVTVIRPPRPTPRGEA